MQDDKEKAIFGSDIVAPPISADDAVMPGEEKTVNDSVISRGVEDKKSSVMEWGEGAVTSRTITVITSNPDANRVEPKPRRGLRFWGVICALCMTSTLAALENTVVATSLPIIVESLDVGHNYIWINNAFFLTR
jgi:hypothetical protein